MHCPASEQCTVKEAKFCVHDMHVRAPHKGMHKTKERGSLVYKGERGNT